MTGSLQDLFLEVTLRYPDRPAIVSEDVNVSYCQLARLVSALSVRLERLGVEPGDSVALLLPNGLGYVTAYFAALAAGAVVTPLNAQYQQNELRYFLEVCSVRALVTNLAHRELCCQVLSSGEVSPHVLFVDEPAGRTAEAPPLVNILKAPAKGAPVMFQFTSGSTGTPKQIARSHKNLLVELESLQRALQLCPEDRFLGLAPFSHVNGLVRSMLASMSCGAALSPLPAFERQAVAEAITRHRLTVFIGVPFHFSMLAKSGFRQAPDFSSLRLCISASAPMPRNMNELFRQRFGHFVRQLYGSTETGSISANLEEDPGPSMNTVGTPLPGVEVEVLRDRGERTEAGELGEFAVRSPAAITAYLNGGDAANAAFRDGWFLTGDLGYRDAGGMLTIAGRKKFFINKGGYKIDPKEIEDVLESHPGVEEAVVVGVPTSYGDEKVTAVVVASGDCSPARIIEFCQGKIASFKIPSVVDIRDSIPKSPTGKIRRALLYPTE